MRQPSQLPRLARWLVRRSPVPRDTRADVLGDLHELYIQRRRELGRLRAFWRLGGDVASLWRRRPSATPAATHRSSLTIVRDAGADLRHASRLFARQPAILLASILGLSLGLGVATAAFSVLNAAVLRGHGLVDPDRAPGVLRVAGHALSTEWTVEEFIHLREGATRMPVEALTVGVARVGLTTADTGAPSTIVAFVSGGFFAATGGRTVVGRPLDPGDETRTGPPPAVVSFAFWTSHFQRDPAVVGRTIRIGRTSAVVVGVADRGFSVPRGPRVWVPLTAYSAVHDAPRSAPDERAGSAAAPAARPVGPGVEVFGRLPPGVSMAEAEAQLGGVAASLPAGTVAEASRVAVRLDPRAGLGREAPPDAAAITALLVAGIVLVLLLSCANVATVLIATAIAREREMGVRAALGASRRRIVRQLVTESLALGTIASGVGLLLASWALPAIGILIGVPDGADIAPDLTVFVFVGVVTVASGVGAGLAPAWHGRGADVVTPLKGDGARPDRVGPRRLRSLLVATQAAVSVLLVVLASLFVRATVRAAAIDVGYDVHGLHAVSLNSFDDERGTPREFWARAIPELQTVPGVTGVALADLTPFGPGIKTAIPRDEPSRVVHLNRTHPAFFETVGLRLLSGRVYTRDEVAANAPVAVVSESFARTYWPDRSPLGHLLPDQVPVEATRPTVVGVVTDAITARFHDPSPYAVYEPLPPAAERSARLLVRVAPDATEAIANATRRLRALDPQADVWIASVGARVNQAVDRPRVLALLSGVVGVIAMVLCVVGLYGLTASVVGQRTRELGVRVALGARPQDLRRLLLRDSLRPVVRGLAVGAALALVAGQVVAATVFFGVSPRDPIAYAGAAAILLAAATIAVILPTRRAAAADASTVLKRS